MYTCVFIHVCLYTYTNTKSPHMPPSVSRSRSSSKRSMLLRERSVSEARASQQSKAEEPFPIAWCRAWCSLNSRGNVYKSLSICGSHVCIWFAKKIEKKCSKIDFLIHSTAPTACCCCPLATAARPWEPAAAQGKIEAPAAARATARISSAFVINNYGFRVRPQQQTARRMLLPL